MLWSIRTNCVCFALKSNPAYFIAYCGLLNVDNLRQYSHCFLVHTSCGLVARCAHARSPARAYSDGKIGGMYAIGIPAFICRVFLCRCCRRMRRRRRIESKRCTAARRAVTDRIAVRASVAECIAGFNGIAGPHRNAAADCSTNCHGIANAHAVAGGFRRRPN